MCGMPWKKASYLTVAGNGADILLPGIVGSIIGVIAVKGVRTFSMDTIYLSALTGFVAVFAVFFISSVIISILL